MSDQADEEAGGDATGAWRRGGEHSMSRRGGGTKLSEEFERVRKRERARGIRGASSDSSGVLGAMEAQFNAVGLASGTMYSRAGAPVVFALCERLATPFLKWQWSVPLCNPFHLFIHPHALFGWFLLGESKIPSPRDRSSHPPTRAFHHLSVLPCRISFNFMFSTFALGVSRRL